MNIRCSFCGTRQPKTEDGKWIHVDNDSWDSSFSMYCREWCRIQARGTNEERANAVLPENQKSTLRPLKSAQGSSGSSKGEHHGA